MLLLLAVPAPGFASMTNLQGSVDPAGTVDCPLCPYDFEPPRCEESGPQAPRDLSSNAPQGQRPGYTPLVDSSDAMCMPLTNVHFHLGAEHKSDSYYLDEQSKAYDEAHEHGRCGTARPRRSRPPRRTQTPCLQSDNTIFCHADPLGEGLREVRVLVAQTAHSPVRILQRPEHREGRGAFAEVQESTTTGTL